MKLLKGRTPNQWDEQLEEGGISESGVPVDFDTRLRSKNYIQIEPSTSYYFHIPLIRDGWSFICWYDADYNFISYESPYFRRNPIITSPQNAKYLKFYINKVNYAEQYNHDISINYPSTDHDYHPYKALIKSGGFLNKIDNVDTLNAILSSGLKAVDLGTLTWEWRSNTNAFRSHSLIGDVAPKGYHCLCDIYSSNATSSESSVTNWADMTIGFYYGAVSYLPTLFVKNSDYETDATAFKQAMSGVILIYKTT